LMKKLKDIGVSVGSSVSKNTDYVIVGVSTEKTGKTEAAKKLGIPVITASNFMKTYFINNTG